MNCMADSAATLVPRTIMVDIASISIRVGGTNSVYISHKELSKERKEVLADNKVDSDFS